MSVILAGKCYFLAKSFLPMQWDPDPYCQCGSERNRGKASGSFILFIFMTKNFFASWSYFLFFLIKLLICWEAYNINKVYCRYILTRTFLLIHFLHCSRYFLLYGSPTFEIDSVFIFTLQHCCRSGSGREKCRSGIRDLGSRINISDHISKSLISIFWVKTTVLYADPPPGTGSFLALDPGYGINIPDPQHCVTEKVQPIIRNYGTVKKLAVFPVFVCTASKYRNNTNC